MKSNNILFILLIVAIVVVFLEISVIVLRTSYYKDELTGYASGFVNLTILTTVAINMSRDTINWSLGVIDSGELNATLYTSGENAYVLRGNWSNANVKGFVVENHGNMNASLFLISGKNASTYFGGSQSQQAYKWNVSNKETGSCNGGLLGQWQEVNISSGGTRVCSQFDFHRNNNEVYIDILFTVPYDVAYIWDLSDTITVIASSAI